MMVLDRDSVDSEPIQGRRKSRSDNISKMNAPETFVWGGRLKKHPAGDHHVMFHGDLVGPVAAYGARQDVQSETLASLQLKLAKVGGCQFETLAGPKPK